MELDLHINDHLHSRTDSHDLLLEALDRVDNQSIASIRVVAIARESGPWSLLYGEVVVAPEATPGPHLELGRMTAVSECLRVPDFATRLRDTFASGRFPCGSVEVDVAQVFQQWSFARYASDRNFSRWPCVVAEGVRSAGSGWGGPFAAVSDGRALFFRDGFDVIAHVTSFPVFRYDSDSRVWTMSVIIEDHRARLVQVERQGEQLGVHVEGHSLDGLVLAGRLGNGTDSSISFSVPIESEVRLELPMGPVAINMGIVARESEILDYRSGHLPAPPPVVPDIKQPLELALVDRVEVLLVTGENAQCEYKPWVEPARSSPKLREIVKTAIAMANGDGGSIIIGVADDGSVNGLDGKILGPFVRPQADEQAEPSGESLDRSTRQLESVRAYGRKLRDEVQQIVEPSLELDLEAVMLDAGSILLVEVRSGTNPPYMIADSREVYVRRNATNRRPTREELRQLHTARVT